MTTYCGCDTPFIDVDHDAACRRCGNPVDFSPKPDVNVENHGSIFLFRLNTDAAREWAEANTPADATYFGGRLAVEHRYAVDVAEGMEADGLVVV